MPLARLARRTLGVVVAVMVIAITGTIGPQSVRAAEIDGLSCSTHDLKRPFLPWLDPLYYALLPNGGFERGGDSWTLSGGAKVVRGNESYYVNAEQDKYSLYLPPSGAVVSTPMCVGELDPTLRVFVRNTGSPLSTLKVDALYQDVYGKSRSTPVATLLGSGTWQPTLPVAFLANLTNPPLVTDGEVLVAFRFTAQGSLGEWSIDDVYVDPFKAR